MYISRIGKETVRCNGLFYSVLSLLQFSPTAIFYPSHIVVYTTSNVVYDV